MGHSMLREDLPGGCLLTVGAAGVKFNRFISGTAAEAESTVCEDDGGLGAEPRTCICLKRPGKGGGYDYSTAPEEGENGLSWLDSSSSSSSSLGVATMVNLDDEELHFVRCCADGEGEVCNGPLPTPAPTSLPLGTSP